MESLWTFLKGLLMGAADIIPGVSGGTIAFITGIYDRLINGLKNAGTHLRKFQLQKIDWQFFIPLVLGIGISFIAGSGIIPELMDTYPGEVYSFFVGLILASAWFVYRQIKAHDATSIIAGVLAFIFGALIALVPKAPSVQLNPLWFLGLGMIAICAMLLPGISGSYILLILGQYEYMLQSIHERNLIVVGLFAIGAIAGLLIFSRVLAWLLKKYHGATFTGLVGLMLGALAGPVKIAVWQTTHTAIAGVLFIVGIIIVFIIENIAK